MHKKTRINSLALDKTKVDIDEYELLQDAYDDLWDAYGLLADALAVFRKFRELHPISTALSDLEAAAESLGDGTKTLDGKSAAS